MEIERKSMNDETKIRPKCEGELELGVFPDAIDLVTSLATGWFKRRPTPSLWTGTRAPVKDRRPIAVYCCRSCGFVEMYAGPAATYE